MSGRTGETQLQRRLRPSLTDERVRQRVPEDAQHMPQQHRELFSTTNPPHFRGHVLVIPQRLIRPITKIDIELEEASYSAASRDN